MATHSSVLAWRVPGTGQPGVLGNIDSRIDLMENQIGDVEDNLKRFP